MIQSKLREVAATAESAMAELMLEAADKITELEAAIVSVGNALIELEATLVNDCNKSYHSTEASQVGMGSQGDEE